MLINYVNLMLLALLHRKNGFAEVKS